LVILRFADAYPAFAYLAARAYPAGAATCITTALMVAAVGIAGCVDFYKRIEMDIILINRVENLGVLRMTNFPKVVVGHRLLSAAVFLRNVIRRIRRPNINYLKK